VDVRRGCDHKIERATARLPASVNDGRRKSPPFTRNGGVDGQWIERRLNDAEALRSTGPLVFLTSNKNAEVKLSE
jgi:hypothetical protein